MGFFTLSTQELGGFYFTCWHADPPFQKHLLTQSNQDLDTGNCYLFMILTLHRLGHKEWHHMVRYQSEGEEWDKFKMTEQSLNTIDLVDENVVCYV